MLRLFLLLFFIQAKVICTAQLLDSLLRADSNLVIRKVMANPEKYRLQIVVSSQSLVVSCQLQEQEFALETPNSQLLPQMSFQVTS